MVYSGQLYISMPNYNSCTYTAFYLSGIQYIFSHLLIANYKYPMWEKVTAVTQNGTLAPIWGIWENPQNAYVLGIEIHI